MSGTYDKGRFDGSVLCFWFLPNLASEYPGSVHMVHSFAVEQLSHTATHESVSGPEAQEIRSGEGAEANINT
jgi:hypothetical protein